MNRVLKIAGLVMMENNGYGKAGLVGDLALTQIALATQGAGLSFDAPSRGYL